MEAWIKLSLNNSDKKTQIIFKLFLLNNNIDSSFKIDEKFHVPLSDESIKLGDVYYVVIERTFEIVNLILNTHDELSHSDNLANLL